VITLDLNKEGVGSTFKRYRIDQGLTQQTIADRLGSRRRADVCKFERGYCNQRLDRIIDFFSTLDLQVQIQIGNDS
jgi:transcriptional regulator with XRE-family HTH domain